MNKLRKKSRTLAYAEAEGPLYHKSQINHVNNPVLTPTKRHVQIVPHSPSSMTRLYPGHKAKHLEQDEEDHDNGLKESHYWAARALHAEIMLSAREAHFREMKSEALNQAEKRRNELNTVTQEHRERHSSLERFVYVLVSIIIGLIFLVIYQMILYSRSNDSKRHRRSTPLHFTIPILSPFTSVVEHETSVINPKIIMLSVIVTGCLAYMIFRYWMSARR
ncbi:hypothetical protein AMATHDRAFT_64117 [Amanita thiersii Skay4041]|uniref:Uncharacterized protein n=1 Tax=Amanita thiersii Skay4041 TaxID=703135 RepID=A0A2A9NFU6_9AGAR|nr:hypothetical protein AMATHDRAFT_64117 [Amanita thiersii Skay4041]